MIKVPDFQVGMAIEAHYISPDTGRPTLDLLDKAGNIIFHITPRMEEHVLILNTKIGDSWGKEERPRGFDFSTGVPITIRVEAHASHYKVLCNGELLHSFHHRMPLTNIKKVMWKGAGSAKKAKLISLSVFF